MAIRLRPATPADLDRVVEIEHAADAAPYLTPWERERHELALDQPHFDHLVIADGKAVEGFLLIDGLTNEHRSVELRKIAVACPGGGVGRKAMRLALARCFEQHRAHRVWLDLKLYNKRARRVYEALGFVVEGTARESYLHEGEFEPLLVMSLLEQEWRTAEAATDVERPRAPRVRRARRGRADAAPSARAPRCAGARPRDTRAS